MGNAVVTNLSLDHEVHHQQEAIEAGTELLGKVVIQVQEELDPTHLTLEVNGKEKTTAIEDDKIIQDKHGFFRADVQLYKMEEKIQPNTYVFPFGVTLPKSLPSSRSYQDSEGSFSIEYNLKLKTSAQGKFPNKRTFEVTSAVKQGESISCLLQPKPIIPEALGIEGKGEVFLGAHVNDTNVVKGQEVQCSLSSRNQSTLRIDRAVVSLEEEYYYTSKHFGGHGKSILFEREDAKRLPGIRVVGLHTSEIETRLTDDETIARRMFKDLKSKSNILMLKIPQTAKESYSGVILQVSHYLRFTLITRTPEEEYPSIRVPIHIGSERPAMVGDLGGYSDHLSDQARVRFPRVRAPPENILLGKNAGVLDSEDSYSVPIPSPMDVEPSLDYLREELAASINDYDLVLEKMKDLDWAIFFASLNPDEYGSIIAFVGTEFAQPRVAALLAKNYGGDFTCAHCAAAIRNVASVFRSNMVEGLLAFCSDLSDNNHLIRGQLSDFEQIIVALHALNEDEAPDEDEPKERSTSSRRRQLQEFPKDVGIPTNILIGADFESDDEKKPPSDMTLETVLTESEYGPSKNCFGARPSGSRVQKNAVMPLKNDVLLGANDHPQTSKLFAATKHEVEQGDSSEYCPTVYRQIKQQFPKKQRYLIAPTKDDPNFWREASKLELIEQIGIVFDSLKQRRNDIETLKGGGAASDQWNDSGIKDGKESWQQALQETKSEWELAVTIHTYTSEIDAVVTEMTEESRGPSISDICFFKPKHPGNAVLVRSIRQALQHSSKAEWSPPIYRAIKKPLAGRRFFIRVSDRAWREASQVERRDSIEKYYELEKKRATLKRDKCRISTRNINTDKPSSGKNLISPDNGRHSRSPEALPEGSGSNRSSRQHLFDSSSARAVRRKDPSADEVASPGLSRRTSMKDGKKPSRQSLGKDSNSERLSRRTIGRHSDGAGRRSRSAGKYKNRDGFASRTPLDTADRVKPRRSNSMGKFSQHPTPFPPPFEPKCANSLGNGLLREQTKQAGVQRTIAQRRKLDTKNRMSPPSVHETGEPERRLADTKVLTSPTRVNGEAQPRRKLSANSVMSASRVRENSEARRKLDTKNRMSPPSVHETGEPERRLADTKVLTSPTRVNGEAKPKRRLSANIVISASRVRENSAAPVKQKSSPNVLISPSRLNGIEGASTRRKPGLRKLLSPTRLKPTQDPPIAAIDVVGNDSSGSLGLNGQDSQGEMALNDTEVADLEARPRLFSRLSRNNSIRKIEKRNMRHPRDMDICYGSENHQGTVALKEAVLKSLHKLAGKPWSPLIYKAIRSDLQGRRFFVRDGRDLPWREASAEERVERTHKLFEAMMREQRRR